MTSSRGQRPRASGSSGRRAFAGCVCQQCQQYGRIQVQTDSASLHTVCTVALVLFVYLAGSPHTAGSFPCATPSRCYERASFPVFFEKREDVMSTKKQGKIVLLIPAFKDRGFPATFLKLQNYPLSWNRCLCPVAPMPHRRFQR